MRTFLYATILSKCYHLRNEACSMCYEPDHSALNRFEDRMRMFTNLFEPILFSFSIIFTDKEGCWLDNTRRVFSK